MKRIELDFLEKRKFTFKNEGVKLLQYFLLGLFPLFLVLSGFFYLKVKSVKPNYIRINSQVNSTLAKVKKEREDIKRMEENLLPVISFLNSGLERKKFSYTEVFYLLEEALPTRAYLTDLTVSSNGKVVFTGFFASSSSIKSFVEKLSAGGKYQVYLMREERKAGGSIATIAWDLKGGKK